MDSADFQATSQRTAAVLRGLWSALRWAALFLGSVWALLAIWFSLPCATWLVVIAAGTWVAFVVLAVARLPRPKAGCTIVVGVVCVWLPWHVQSPSNSRDWEADQDRMPVAHFRDCEVEIENVRYARYRSTDDYDVTWCTRKYDLNDLRTVDFVLEHFASWEGPAHTFLTFGFADGQYVAISVEIRKEKGESFAGLPGLFKKYEIMYVVGDERDLIGLRVNVRKDPVHLYPIKANQELIRTLFVTMLQRANTLAEQPEFYNTLTNTCTTNLVRHLEQVSQRDVPFDFRVLLPGYADTMAYELGLIDCDPRTAECQSHYLVKETSREAQESSQWSQQIRASQGGAQQMEEEPRG